MKILCVEDDILISRLVCMALTKLGHEPIPARNGEEAWELYQKNPTPIVVSDWEMPIMDGLELCAHIRARKQQTYTYFIMLTSHNSTEEYLHAMDHGVDDFLRKPLNESLLGIRLQVATRILGFQRELDSLKGIIPICGYCHKIRKDERYWEDLGRFLEANLERDVSHGICPDCYTQHVEPQLRDLDLGTR